VSGSARNALLQDTKKLFSFLGLRIRPACLPSVVEHLGLWRAVGPDVPRGLGRVGVGDPGLSCCPVLCGVRWVRRHSPHPYPAHLYQFHHFRRVRHRICHREGLVLNRGPLGRLVHARQEVCLGLRVRWVIGKGVRWVPRHGREFETLCARFGGSCWEF
jgi:hypothetical protein